MSLRKDKQVERNAEISFSVRHQQYVPSMVTYTGPIKPCLTPDASASRKPVCPVRGIVSHPKPLAVLVASVFKSLSE